VDRVPSRPPAERVEVKARLVQRFKGRRVVDRGQANQSPVVQIRPHASAFAGLEQLSQSTVPKAFDHTAGDVNRGLTSVKSGLTDRTANQVRLADREWVSLEIGARAANRRGAFARRAAKLTIGARSRERAADVAAAGLAVAEFSRGVCPSITLKRRSIGCGGWPSKTRRVFCCALFDLPFPPQACDC
jgi:hypothetical protein